MTALPEQQAPQGPGSLHRAGLPTPALLLDRGRARANIETLAERLNGRVAHWPHTKIHKCAELAELQLAGGADGLTVATVHEAGALIDRGLTDLLIANEIVGLEKLAVLGALACRARLTVAVDDARHVEALDAACARAGAELGVLIDVDLGVGRCGVRAPQEACALAALVEAARTLELRGVLGYEGHAMMIRDPIERRRVASAAYGRLETVVERLRQQGHAVATVSAGGTGTYELAAEQGFINQIRAGSYALMDGSYLPIAPEFALASTVLATVISRKRDSIVLDCGVKAIDTQLALPLIIGEDARPRYVAEEHLAYDVCATCELDVGSRVELVPMQCGPTVNLHGYHHVIENGDVVDTWPVLARGPGRP